MAYTTRAAIESKIPAPLLVEALDDDRDGQLDDEVLAQVIANAETEVNSILEGLYPVPFVVDVPACCQVAALMFCCEEVYRRRGVEKNPFDQKAKDCRETLRKIGSGELPLTTTVSSTSTSGVNAGEVCHEFTRGQQNGL